MVPFVSLKYNQKSIKEDLSQKGEAAKIQNKRMRQFTILNSKQSWKENDRRISIYREIEITFYDWCLENRCCVQSSPVLWLCRHIIFLSGSQQCVKPRELQQQGSAGSKRPIIQLRTNRLHFLPYISAAAHVEQSGRKEQLLQKWPCNKSRECYAFCGITLC